MNMRKQSNKMVKDVVNISIKMAIFIALALCAYELRGIANTLLAIYQNYKLTKGL